MRSLLALLLIGILAAGCKAEAEREPVPEASHWWKGNLHTHSLWSDGDEFPETIIGWYAEHGYDFIALSDHNTLAEGERWIKVPDGSPIANIYEAYLAQYGEDWVESRTENDTLQVRLKTLEEYRTLFEDEEDFLIIQSEEISDGFDGKPIHVNATNIQERIAPQGGTSVTDVMQRNVDAVLAQREETGTPMFPHINHPNFIWAITAEDLIPLQGERFFEVHNGHPLVHNHGDHQHPSTERLWDIILTERLAHGDEVMYGLATDDAHNYHQYDSTRSNPGRAWVMVRAESLTPDALIAAMEAGDFYATTGVLLDDMHADSSTIRLTIQPQDSVTYRTQFIGTREGYDPASEPMEDAEGVAVTRRYSDSIGTVLAEVEGLTPSYTMQGDEVYVRAKIISSKPKDNPLQAGEVETAWTQPVSPPKQ
ncbi:MAG TPA: hypothetical protein VKP65_04015 [Rhodothermales bacterium]|nr:hypothetical protein [Rhodothermales bacterium]